MEHIHYQDVRNHKYQIDLSMLYISALQKFFDSNLSIIGLHHTMSTFFGL
jgi:hypothetical protein